MFRLLWTFIESESLQNVEDASIFFAVRFLRVVVSFLQCILINELPAFVVFRV